MPDNNMATIAISITDITDRCMAASALRHTLDGSRPPLLHNDHRAALRPFVQTAFAGIALALSPWATDCNLDGREEILSIELAVPGNVAAALLRSITERAVMSAVMAVAYRGVSDSLATEYDNDARLLTDALRQSFAEADFASAPPRIMAHRY